MDGNHQGQVGLRSDSPGPPHPSGASRQLRNARRPDTGRPLGLSPVRHAELCEPGPLVPGEREGQRAGRPPERAAGSPASDALRRGARKDAGQHGHLPAKALDGHAVPDVYPKAWRANRPPDFRLTSTTRCWLRLLDPATGGRMTPDQAEGYLRRVRRRSTVRNRPDPPPRPTTSTAA